VPLLHYHFHSHSDIKFTAAKFGVSQGGVQIVRVGEIFDVEGDEMKREGRIATGSYA